MRKLIVLLLVVFLPIASILAQTIEDKEQVYDLLKEWAVVKLTIAYMEDYRLFTPEEKGEKGTEKEYKTYKTLIRDYQDYSNEKKINLEDVSQFLINGDWSTTKNNVFDSYKAFVVDSISDSRYNQIPAFGYSQNISQNNFETTIIELNKKFSELINKKNNAEDNSNFNETKEEDDNKESQQVKSPTNKDTVGDIRERTSGLSFWVYGILGALIVAVIIIFILISMNKNLKRSLKAAKRVTENHTSYQSLSNSTAMKLRDEKQELERKVDKLEIEIKNLSMVKSSPIENANANIIIDTPSQSIELNVPKQKTSNIIYLSSPFQNLTFANEDASKDKTSNSIYQVEFNEQLRQGELSIIEDSNLARALNSPDTYLETACAYENEYSNNARTIKVIEKGEIKLEGEDWIVTKKVRIKFI